MGGWLVPGTFLAQVNDGGGVDVGTMLASYGIAAPFAGLCFWVMVRTQKKLDDANETIAQMNRDAIAREREYLQRVAPLIYDGAMLYREGNQLAAQAPAAPTNDELHRLAGKVDDLVRKLEEGGDGRGP